MPVVRVDLRRFAKMVGTDRKKIIDRIPYIGLDIESVDRDSIRVEYSPNRPDFGTDFGIARSLKGLLGKEVGLPRFPVSPSGVSVSVDRRLSSIRPHIGCVVARGLRLDDEDVRQLISLQEDLHNGLGRRRKLVAIGLHDLDALYPPLSYIAVKPSFRFVPLGGTEPMTMASILRETHEGKAYGSALPGTGLLPAIVDSKGTVLSFPPVINGNATRVTSKTKSLLVDVTSTDGRAGDDVLAVVATTLAAAGGRLETVNIRSQGKRIVTPDLTPATLPLDASLVRSVLGLDLSEKEILRSLAKSRLGVKGRNVLAPRYRVDLMHPVDLAEEVAIGYGFDRIEGIYPPSGRPGSFNQFEDFLDSAATVMAGAGMVEMMTYELTDEAALCTKFNRPASGLLRVQNPKSLEHSVLRDALIPTLMASLSGNVRSDYPQRVFEIGRVYSRAEAGVSEAWHLGCCVAHSQSSFTEAKMYLEAACRTIAGREVVAKESENWAFAHGRCASVLADGSPVGHVGEMEPEVIEAFGLGVPVSGFELDLTQLFELLK
ncbi:MAG: phenylalanine--tRNA ligase subunit beta [Nitrososphaerota archaeon]|nr:phenylalanine--tRNA ligase subunit beta [Nitrososphaerota archaeon]